MSLYKHPRSPFYWYRFEVAGKCHRRSTGCKEKRAAEKVEEAAREEAEAAAKRSQVITAANVSLRIEDASTRYHAEVCEGRASEDNALRELDWLIEHFGADRLLTTITDADVGAMIAKRREERVPKTKRRITPNTVNRTTLRLRGLMTHAERDWHVQFPLLPNWRRHMLHVDENKARVLSPDERTALFAATRPDYLPFVEFALTSALRLASCVSLRWIECDFTTGEIRKPGKRLPSGKEKVESVPMTARIREILESQRGNDPGFVFTYEAQRSFGGRKKGKRYPLAYEGALSEFERAMAKAGIEDFGFHGLRRTRATTVWKTTRDLASVSKMLNHRDPGTTMKYLGIDVSDVAAAMEKTDSAQEAVTLARHTEGQNHAKSADT